VFCHGRVFFYRRIQQQIFLGNSGVRNLGRIPVVLRHKRVALSKSKAMTRRVLTFQMTKPLSLLATLALGGRRSSWSR
jgi:hypothetical protein